jgi:hypothetical protein
MLLSAPMTSGRFAWVFPTAEPGKLLLVADPASLPMNTPNPRSALIEVINRVSVDFTTREIHFSRNTERMTFPPRFFHSALFRIVPTHEELLIFTRQFCDCSIDGNVFVH